MTANSRQVGGEHYKKVMDRTGGLQHWDIVHMFELDYFQGNITKYLFRWRSKNGVQDLEKARHYLDKYIELAKKDEAHETNEAAVIAECRGPSLASIQEQFGEVARAAAEDERAAMDEYARSLNGDIEKERTVAIAESLSVARCAECGAFGGAHDDLCANVPEICGVRLTDLTRCTLALNHEGPHGDRRGTAQDRRGRTGPGVPGVPPHAPAGAGSTPTAGGAPPSGLTDSLPAPAGAGGPVPT